MFDMFLGASIFVVSFAIAMFLASKSWRLYFLWLGGWCIALVLIVKWFVLS